ncbi:MAG TPA: DNA polymerase III subunit gamma/tau [Gemmatimonadaceae bacterium]|nr:DNA polymerase III subunit gamma/tau [Gemmatimonadaceae bacterium]
MSISLARKYRPRRFADVAVQSHVSTTLQGAIAKGRVAHGYLFCGPRGTGKTTLARVLAMALNCERRASSGDDASNKTRLSGPAGAIGAAGDDASNKTRLSGPAGAGEPCGECESCRRIWAGSASLDVVEIDAASNRGVDDARELRERAMYAPSGDDRYKVYIVDEAHMLTREAWNALLKILEEPPPRVVFVFATTEPQKITQAAAPVMSRLQRFDLRRIGSADIRSRLGVVLGAEGVTADPDALALIARAADGSMRDALSLADQVLSLGDGSITPQRVRDALGLVPEDEFLSLLTIIAEHRAADVFPFVGRLAEAGVDFSTFLAGFGDMVRAQLAVVLGGTPTDVSDRARDALVAGAARFQAADLVRMLTALTELEPRFRRSGQQQLLIETAMVRFALLDRTVDVEALLRTLGGDDRGAAQARPEPRQADPPRNGSAPAAARSTTPASARPATPPPVAHESRPAPRREPTMEAPRTVQSSAQPAPSLPPESALEPIDANALTGRWDDLVSRLRQGGKTLIATALEHATPAVVTARGDITIALDEPNDFYARAIQSGGADIVAILREWFAPVERVQLEGSAKTPTVPQKRLTDEDVKAQKLEALKKRDPLLSAAIDALDLEVID